MNATIPGQVLAGRYLLGRPLGKGGWGAVFEAKQLDLGRLVAIKMLHGESSTDRGDLARFEREARAAAALAHPNIVQILDFVAAEGEPPFIVLEHLEGRTLSALLTAERSLVPVRAVAIIKQVLAALEVAHRAGIVHRDVKPANVFLVSGPGIEDFVKLLDFGIAKVATDAQKLTAMGAAIGTPHFMPPEQVLGKPVDARVDVYAAGVTLYLALSGRLPFEGDAQQVMMAVLEIAPPPLASLYPALPPALVHVVERAMAKDPAERFESVFAMRAALDSVALGPWEVVATPRTLTAPATGTAMATVAEQPLSTRASLAPASLVPATPTLRRANTVLLGGLAVRIHRPEVVESEEDPTGRRRSDVGHLHRGRSGLVALHDRVARRATDDRIDAGAVEHEVVGRGEA